MLGRAGERELGQYAADLGRELEGVAGADGEQDVLVARKPVEHEVAVRRQGVEAGLDEAPRPTERGKVVRMNSTTRRRSSSSGANERLSAVVSAPPPSRATLTAGSPNTGKP